MKLLYCTDLHFSGKQRSFRLDNYAESLLLKLEEMVQEAIDQQVEAVLFGGDFFDSPKVSRFLLGRIISVLRRLPCPLYIVEGNHDTFGYDAKTVYQTDLGILFRTGLATRINRMTGGVMLFGKRERVMVWLEAQEYHKDIDRRPASEDYVIKDQKQLAPELVDAGFKLYRILMAHGMLLPKEHVASHTLISSIPENHGFDHLVVGHYHPGFDSVEIHGGWVHNIGSMARTDAGWDNLDRLPPYAIIECTEEGSTLTKYHFKSAKPSDQVLDRSKRDKAKARAQVLQEFADDVDNAGEFKGETVIEILDSIIKAGGLAPEDRAEALRWITKAEQEIDDKASDLDGFIERPGVKIKEVEIWYFQSWHHVKFTVDNGLNVIVGPSDNGKSALLRAIRWCLYNDPDGFAFVTGATEEQQAGREAKVTITFSDGTKLTRKRPGKKTNSGSYIIEWPDGREEEFKGFAHNPPIAIFNASQMPLIPVGKNGSMSLNVAMQADTLFMVQSSPQERNALIGKLAGVQAVDFAISLVDKQLKADAKTLKLRQKDLKDLEGKLQAFDHLDAEKALLDEVERLFQQYELETREIELLSTLKASLDEATTKKREVQAALAPLAGVDEAARLLAELQSLASETEDLERLRNGLKDTWSQLTYVRKDLVSLGDVLTAENELMKAKLLLQEVDALSTYQDRLVASRGQRAETAGALERYKALASAEKYLDLTHRVMDEIKELSQFSADLTALRGRIEKGRGMVAQAREQERQASEHYAKLLATAGVCPTCFTKVDREHILAHLLAS